MDGVSLNTANSAVESSLVANADADTDKSVKLIKKAMQSDKDMVDKLLPPASSGQLDITA